jgi:pantoate--beta-alanine ligase
MDVFKEIAPLRDHIRRRRAGRPVVLVPTMGALHDGHRALVDLARSERDALVVATIFVNPTQFGPREDLDAYPRALERDLSLCRDWGCDLVFTPDERVMYPAPQTAWVVVEGITEDLCGAVRPGHFRGVATVVAKLFHIVLPDAAVFGQKDAQQALVIREMVRRLDMAVEIRLAPTVREEDGLAMSSRNAYLEAAARTQAAAIHRALRAAGDAIASGEREARRVEAAARAVLEDGGIADVEYAELRAAGDLSPLERIEGRVILAVAARVGGARLIDNMVYEVRDDTVTIDTALF